MSELFDMYEENLNDSLNKISNIINIMPNLSKEKTESAINEANNHLQEAQSLIKKLEIETSASTTGDKLLLKIKNYKAEFEKIKKKFISLQNHYINQKSNEALYLNTEDDNRQNNNLVENEEVAYNQHSKLEQGKRAMLEIESGGNDALKQLHHQTKIMNNALNNLDNEIEVLDHSNSLMKRMLRRENRNKLLIAVFLIVIILISLIVAICFQ
jgi:hypothetical protein